MAAASTTPAALQQIVAGFQKLRRERQEIVSRLADLEHDLSEHRFAPVLCRPRDGPPDDTVAAQHGGRDAVERAERPAVLPPHWRRPGGAHGGGGAGVTEGCY